MPSESNRIQILDLLVTISEHSDGLHRSVEQLRELLDGMPTDCVDCSSCSTGRSPRDHPIADDATLSVIWGERRCYLGKTLGFRLFVHLAIRRNQYVAYDSLFEVVWGGRRSNGAVRSVVRDLRRKLRRAGMSDLADAIDGRNHECYGLILDRRET